MKHNVSLLNQSAPILFIKGGWDKHFNAQKRGKHFNTQRGVGANILTPREKELNIFMQRGVAQRIYNARDGGVYDIMSLSKANIPLTVTSKSFSGAGI